MSVSDYTYQNASKSMKKKKLDFLLEFEFWVFELDTNCYFNYNL